MNKTIVQVMIVALLWIIVATGGRVGGDSARRLQITHGWLTGEEEVVLEPNYKIISRLDPNAGVVGVGGKRFHGDELGQSVLMLPGDWLGTQLLPFFPKQNSEYFRQIVVNWVVFVPLNLAAIVAVYLLLRLLGFSEPISGLSSLIFLTCTTFLHYIQVNQQNNQIFLFVVLGYATAIIAVKSGKLGWLILSGLALGFACLIRSSSIIHVLSVFTFLIGCLIYQNRNFLDLLKSVVIWIGGLLPFIILARTLNYFRFGSFWETGQTLGIKQSNQDALLKNFPALPQNYPFINPAYEGIIGVLFTPAKSIFIYDPLLLPCLVLAVVYWKEISPYVQLYLITALFNLALYIIALSRFDFWHGDSAWGARYHITSVHLILIPLIPILLERVVFVSGAKAKLAKALLIFALIIQLMSLVFRPSTESKSIYFARLESFNNFRLLQRANNIICVVTPYPSPECRKKLEFKDYKNLRKRFALFPFAFTKGQHIFFVFWGLILALALFSSLRLWNIYKPF
jgi:hypothetical protein